MKYRDCTREVRARTAPREAAIARVRERLDRQLVSARAELSHLPEPTELQAARVRARLRERPAERRAPVWFPAATLAAAAAMLAIVTVAAPRPAEPVSVAISGEGSALAVTDHVRVSHDGRGAVAGTDRDLVVDWEIGRIDLDVDPGQGIALQVRTTEGTVRVVGTRFSVVRDALGTAVEVEHGSVQVDCAAGGGARLGAGEETGCVPVTAAGWLARARALEDRGASTAELLASADAGLGLDATGAIGAELEITRMGALLKDGRSSEALEAAERALAGAEASRAEELHRAAARLALAAGDCARALPHLDALRVRTADEEAYRARCAGR